MFDLILFRRRRGEELTVFEDSFNSLFSNFFNDFRDAGGFSFKADIKEKEDKYWIEAELPGLNKEDINIELNDEKLLISASRNEFVEKNKDNYVYRERNSGNFQRGFYLKNIKEDQIKAEYKNGILKIELPKKESGTKRKRVIDIN